MSTETPPTPAHGALASTWQALKRELKVALKTFGATWLGFTLLLQLLCALTSKDLHGVVDFVALLTIGFVVCAVYTFWPALGVAACRVVYRLLGWGAFAGAFVIVAGCISTLVLCRHWLGALFVEIFASAAAVGPCGAHAGGPAAVLALFCIVVAVVASPASWWALFKLLLLASAALLAGSMPGVLLWLVLLLRKAVTLASRHNEASS